MIVTPAGVKVHLALGHTDMRKGLDGLATLIQEHLKKDPFSGHLFVFRGKNASLLKILFWDKTGDAGLGAGAASYRAHRSSQARVPGLQQGGAGGRAGTADCWRPGDTGTVGASTGQQVLRPHLAISTVANLCPTRRRPL